MDPRENANHSGANQEDNNAGNAEHKQSRATAIKNPIDHRIRNDSESSTDSMTRYVLATTDGSPPKVVTLDEISSMLKNLKNMELAHEIALNPDFKLQQYEPPFDSMEARIKMMVHKAFWDLLREQLESSPPSFDQAIRLLSEIKDCFPDILAPNSVRTLQQINEVLDDALIRQQAERGTLDFKSYANFVIKILARICSPARDEAVAKLRDIDDVVDMFRGILQIMSLMKLDMANFLLAIARKDIAANSVEYEKAKFSKYWQDFHPQGGFKATEEWLNRNRVGTNYDDNVYNAYMELLDYPKHSTFPEMLQMDMERFTNLGIRALRLVLCASLISIAQSATVISQRRDNRTKLAEQLEIIIQDVNKSEDVDTAIANCYEQIRSFINEALAKEQLQSMPESVEDQLKTQVYQLQNKTAAVRQLMSKRLDGFIRVGVRSNGSMPAPPAGFAEFQQNLVAFVASLRRLMSYNHAVFGEYFALLLNKPIASSLQQEEPIANSTSSSSSSPSSAGASSAQVAKP